jgi:hypothetical protein
MSHQESTARTPAVIAADLRRIADMFDTITDPMPDFYVGITMQPHTLNNDAETIRVVDAVGQAVAGENGASQLMGDRTYHYDLSTQVGCVNVDVYTSISSPAAREQAAELERLRAELARLKATNLAAAILLPDAEVPA